MATTAVSISEYLSTSYQPDCDYVDGEIQERNLGTYDHGRLQFAIALYFHTHREEWGVTAAQEQRVQVSATRFRVPDVCVILGPPTEQIFRQPPFIVIEVLSPDDRLSQMQERMDDYLHFGVPYVWLIDRQTRKAWRYTPGAITEVSELRTENPTMVVPLEALFT